MPVLMVVLVSMLVLMFHIDSALSIPKITLSRCRPEIQNTVVLQLRVEP